MKVKSLFLVCPCIMLIFVTCCATNRPAQAENGTDTAVADNNNIDETVTIENVTVEKYFAELPADKPFDPEDFARYLTGMEVVKVFYDQNFEQLIRLPGKEKAGRRYFDYQSPLYSRPISSADEMFSMLNHQALIARQLNTSYVLNLDMDIRKGESRQPERKTITLNIRPGIAISGYRRESELRYTLKASDGSLKYGQYIVASAIVTQDKEDADLYRAFQTWLEQPETTEFSGLFGKMLMKKDD